MNYFCDVHVQSKRDQERRLFVILAALKDGESPHLTKEELKLNIRPLLRLVCKKFFGEFTGRKLVIITISSMCIMETLL